MKTLSLTACALLASNGVGTAAFAAYFEIDKEYRQDSSGLSNFREGFANMVVDDGDFLITAGCAFNGDYEPFEVNGDAGCNIGSNSLAIFPGFDNFPEPDGDGIADPQYYELVSIEEAAIVEPGRSDLIKLVARPPSTFPSKINDFSDNSFNVFFDLNTEDFRQYDNTFYTFTRDYTSRKTMESEIVQGIYQFSFPTRNRATVPLLINFPVVNTIEGYVTKPIKTGFQFIDVRPFEDGFAEYDPRVVNLFRWKGLVGGPIRSTDRLYLAFHSLETTGDPNSDLGSVLFPPGNIRIRLDSPFQSEYALPPGFIGVGPNAALGQEAILQVTVDRPRSSEISPVSVRRFQLPVKFVRSFAATMSLFFPATTPAASLEKTADPDGDGVSNWVEWVSGTDPAKANPPKTLSAPSYVPPSSARSGEPSTGYWQMSLDRPTHLSSKVSFPVEFSTDLKTWTTISESDPNWKVIDNPAEPQLRVISKTPVLTGKRYFRVRYSDAG